MTNKTNTTAKAIRYLSFFQRARRAHRIAERPTKLFDDELAVHEHEMPRAGAKKRVIAPGLQSARGKSDRRFLAAADDVGRRNDARIAGRQVVRRPGRLAGLRQAHVIFRFAQHEIVPHDVGRELADMLERDGNFLAAPADLELLLHELYLVVALDGQGTLLAPRLASYQKSDNGNRR